MMAGLAARYVVTVDRINYRFGRFAMYLIFAMMAVLLWSSFTKTVPFMRPSLWTLETAQYLMVAFYMLGGAYALQLKSNVRMDLFYGTLSLRSKALVDSITVFFMLIFLIFLWVGGLNSFAYSLGHFEHQPATFFGTLAHALFSGGPDAALDQLGVLERSSTAWRPPLWPVKLAMMVGITLMILQAMSEFLKDVARFRTGVADPYGTEPVGAGDN